MLQEQSKESQIEAHKLKYLKNVTGKSEAAPSTCEAVGPAGLAAQKVHAMQLRAKLETYVYKYNRIGGRKAATYCKILLEARV